jgi:hypothetical protein
MADNGWLKPGQDWAFPMLLREDAAIAYSRKDKRRQDYAKDKR